MDQRRSSDIGLPFTICSQRFIPNDHNEMPASLAALSAQLEELASAIESQKQVLTVKNQVLEDLERTRTAVRRQFNSLRDPITRLPLEISSEIFIHGLIHPSYNPNPLIAPLLFINICNSWTNIALSTSALWANLALRLPRQLTPEYKEFFSGWLGRAGAHPLSLWLSGWADEEVGVIVSKHAHHLQKLDLDLLTDPHGVFPCGNIFPCLKTLSIRDMPHSLCTVNESVQIFQSALNLLECIVSNRAHYRVSYQGRGAADVIHPSLQSLKLGGDAGGSILQFLTLPALKSLDIPFSASNPAYLIPFLTRSSPPLQHLTLDPSDGVWSRQTIEDCFRLLPALTHLDLRGSADLQDCALLILADSASKLFLPDLTHLTIVTGPFGDKEFYATLADMLSVRRTSSNVSVKLQSFHIEWDSHLQLSENVRPILEENVKNILRSLMADGMEIYIGRGRGAPNLLDFRAR
ncbi:hypothetical protein FB451DRAFT_1552378 [Mycena latifolia]|nr:hypothetical protein FB451DRAFT_1552378 [Mycena latifolia]